MALPYGSVTEKLCFLVWPFQVPVGPGKGTEIHRVSNMLNAMWVLSGQSGSEDPSSDIQSEALNLFVLSLKSQTLGCVDGTKLEGLCVMDLSKLPKPCGPVLVTPHFQVCLEGQLGSVSPEKTG